MKSKIRIQRVSAWNIGITIGVALLFALISIWGEKEFHILQTTTEEYIQCEKAAKQLQDGSDYLTEQVRLYVITGEQEYMDLYFEEADTVRRRETALDNLQKYFDGTEAFTSLEGALNYSEDLMNTEYYSMRLAAEARETDQESWPEQIAAVELSAEDEALSAEEKISRAEDLVFNGQYQDQRVQITENVSECVDRLSDMTRSRQSRASTIFSDMYLKMEIGIAVLTVLMLAMCFVIRKLIVKPLIVYNESIRHGVIFPVIGAEELQSLARTYNRMYEENQETQKLIRHEAEHDALTDLLNRGSFEKVLKIYEGGVNDFAMIIVDVDSFKTVNDTWGHATGDEILKRVATLLQRAFRSEDFVCRIGGDEFAVIMVEMTTELQYTIEDKIEYINRQLAKEEKGLPPISLSVGIAFTDREEPGESIFKDADKALYYVKEHGKGNYHVYTGALKDGETGRD